MDRLGGATVRYLLERIGRRGAVILLLAALEILIGYGLLKLPPILYRALILSDVIPAYVWGLMWLLSGVFSAPFAFVKTGKDQPGFIALYYPPAVWGLLYLLSGIAGTYPQGVWGALRATIVYWAYSGVIFIVSGMISANDIVSTQPRNGGPPGGD